MCINDIMFLPLASFVFVKIVAGLQNDILVYNFPCWVDPFLQSLGNFYIPSPSVLVCLGSGDIAGQLGEGRTINYEVNIV